MSADDFDTLEVSAISDDAVVDVPAGKGVCPDCGKLLTITAAGTLRQHKCINDIPTGGDKGHGSRAKRPRTPTTVRNLGVALIAGGVEYTAAASVSRWAECDPAEVPADLGDQADVMIGPILDGIWPRIPKEAQKVIKSIADESDLLVAAMAWWEYSKALKEWGEAKKALSAVEAVPTRGYQDEPVSSALNGDRFAAGPLQPFTPDPVSGPPL